MKKVKIIILVEIVGDWLSYHKHPIFSLYCNIFSSISSTVVRKIQLSFYYLYFLQVVMRLYICKMVKTFLF